MRKFKNPYEVSRMNVKELLQYRLYLKNTIKHMRREVEDLNRCFDDVDIELKCLITDFTIKLKKLEKKRLTADSFSELDDNNLH